MNITVDGNKQLHDACRLFSDGTGSYDLAHAAALDQLNKGNLGNKITLSPFNVEYLFDGIKTFIEDGFRYINMNCCFEDVWNKDSALKLFEQLILLSDWITENDLYDKLYVAMLSSASYFPVNDSILEHGWCGVGSKNMISLDYKGILYPCIRFMPSSLGNEREPLTLGDLNNGLL